MIFMIISMELQDLLVHSLHTEHWNTEESVEQTPSCSAVQHSFAVEISNTAVKWIVHKDLSYCPYKIQISQHIKDEGKMAFLSSCFWKFLDNVPDVSSVDNAW